MMGNEKVITGYLLELPQYCLVTCGKSIVFLCVHVYLDTLLSQEETYFHSLYMETLKAQ